MQTLLQMENDDEDPKAIGHDGHANNPKDPFNENAPPFYNLDWKNSHGIGLLQITIYQKGRTDWARWRDSNTPSRNINGRFYTLPELLEPTANADAGASHFKWCSNVRGTDNYEQVFTCYNAGNTVDTNSYGKTANAAYQQCLKEGNNNQP